MGRTTHASALRRIPAIATLCAANMLPGCSQTPDLRVPLGVAPPDAVARQAMAAYDADGDGFLVGSELEACPGMLWQLNGFDANGDKRVSEQEIAARIGVWFDHGVGLMSFSCRIVLDGRPLRSAAIRLEPEAFLGPQAKVATGFSDARGNAALSIDPGDLPAGHQQRRVVQPGLYKVRITHPDVELPRRYNEQTTLGCEVAFDLHRTETPEFKLTSR